jgi:ABC-type anion transport system duplicated permease subunit
MRFVALIVWFVTALWGLYMLAVWLIENDATRQGSAASRLPLPVILAHVTFAVTGLVVWVAYLLLDRPVLAWTAVGILVAIAVLGLSMFARWIPVYRMADDEISVPVGAMSGGAPGAAHRAVPGMGSLQEQPAESSFPLLIVLAHGVFAVSTVVLVVLTALSGS